VHPILREHYYPNHHESSSGSELEKLLLSPSCPVYLDGLVTASDRDPPRHGVRTEAERGDVEAELADVNELFSVGQNELHRVPEAQSRLATAAQQGSRSRADYACALMRLHYRTGTLLDYYHIELVDPAANN
jgi:hypothetical protein